MAGSFVSNFGNGSITEGTSGSQNPETRALTQQLKEAKREAATLQVLCNQFSSLALVHIPYVLRIRKRKHRICETSADVSVQWLHLRLPAVVAHERGGNDGRSTV